MLMQNTIRWWRYATAYVARGFQASELVETLALGSWASSGMLKVLARLAD